jgi:hypothetical protein
MGGKCNLYHLERNIDVESLAKYLTIDLQNMDYKVEYLRYSKVSSSGPYLGYTIKIEKNSKLRKVIGAREKFEIIIEGVPDTDNIKICVEAGERGKNILSTTATTLPVGIMTVGIGTMVALGANMYSQKRFKNNIWDCINNNIARINSR